MKHRIQSVLVTIFVLATSHVLAQVQFEPHFISDWLPVSLLPVDIDSDGDVDVLKGRDIFGGVLLYENDGEQNFSWSLLLDSYSDPSGMVGLDMDEDGDMDLVVEDYYLEWYENDGNQDFTIHTVADDVNPSSVAIGDMNGDNYSDIIITSQGRDKVYWYANDGDQNFVEYEIDSLEDAVDVFVIDIDADGDLDVLVAAESNIVRWYENDGDAFFSAHTISDTLDSAHQVAAADMDGDSDIDIVAAAEGPTTLIWYENDGSEVYTSHTLGLGANNENVREMRIADLTNDGNIDIIVTNGSYSEIAWYENDGTGQFSRHIAEDAFGSVHLLQVADMDGDDDIDFVASEYGEGTIYWYENSFPPIVIKVDSDEFMHFVPAAGDTFYFPTTFTNQADSVVTFDYWSKMDLPIGTSIDPFFGPEPITLDPDETIEVELEVPFVGPDYQGFYMLTIFAGEHDTVSHHYDDIRFYKINSVGIDDDQMQPHRFMLFDNYPNPFNPSTVIRYELKGSRQVSLEIFDISGRHIKTLVESEHQSTNTYEVSWDGTDKFGSIVASGLYIYQLRARAAAGLDSDDAEKGGFIESKKMLLIR